MRRLKKRRSGAFSFFAEGDVAFIPSFATPMRDEHRLIYFLENVILSSVMFVVDMMREAILFLKTSDFTPSF